MTPKELGVNEPRSNSKVSLPTLLIVIALLPTNLDRAVSQTAGSGVTAADERTLCTGQTDSLEIALERDLELDCLWNVRSGTRLYGNGKKLTVGPNGRIVLRQVNDIHFKDTNFVWDPGDLTKNNPGTMFEIDEASSVFIQNNSFEIIGLPNGAPRSSWVPNRSLGAMIRLSGPLANAELSGNKFNAGPDMGFALLGGNAAKSKLRVSKNSISKFYHALRLINCTDCVVTQNRLTENAGGNIVVTGKDIKIIGNAVWFAGLGVHGDSITVGTVENLEIIRNRMFYGYCYGVWFVERANNVLIQDNVISGGITTGMYFANSDSTSPDNFTNITIRGNMFYNNSAWGLGVQNAKNMRVEKNFFVANKPFFSVSKSEMAAQNVTLNENKYIDDAQAPFGGRIPQTIANELDLAVPWDP